MNDLIGKKFRRNKYGLSTWEDEIVRVYYHIRWMDKFSFKEAFRNGLSGKEISEKLKEQRKWGFQVIPVVQGKILENNPYQLDEIIIYP